METAVNRKIPIKDQDYELELVSNKFGIKGQLISKCPFDIVNFFQKTNESKSHSTHSSKVEFIRSFFGRNVSLKKSFRL